MNSKTIFGTWERPLGGTVPWRFWRRLKYWRSVPQCLQGKWALKHTEILRLASRSGKTLVLGPWEDGRRRPRPCPIHPDRPRFWPPSRNPPDPRGLSCERQECWPAFVDGAQDQPWARWVLNQVLVQSKCLWSILGLMYSFPIWGYGDRM